MRIAFTADNHLTAQARHPERYQALADIFSQCGALNVQLLVIAGDLFDQTLANYPDFERLYRDFCPADLKVVIIPGNHDQNLKGAALAGENLQVYSRPTLKPLNHSRQILFLPYQAGITMGEAIAPFADQLKQQRWILVGHGDWVKGINVSDPYEQGLYMPLTSADLKLYKPEIAVLGHIHLPQGSGIVQYPGSPCPLDITETGLRKFILLDTDQGKLDFQLVNSPILFYDETFFLFPTKDDLTTLEGEIRSRLASWQLPQGWEDRVQVRIKLSGSVRSDRQAITDLLAKLFKPYSFYQQEPPDLAGLVHNTDPDLLEIAQRFEDWLGSLGVKDLAGLPDKAIILEQALKLIYRID